MNVTFLLAASGSCAGISRLCAETCDATHFIARQFLAKSLASFARFCWFLERLLSACTGIVDDLRRVEPAVRIIGTGDGSPAVGPLLSRLPCWPFEFRTGERTRRVANMHVYVMVYVDRRWWLTEVVQDTCAWRVGSTNFIVRNVFRFLSCLTGLRSRISICGAE